MNPIIKVENISKRYKLGLVNRHTFGDELAYQWLKLRGKNPAEHMGAINRERKGAGDFWALRDVSFEVNPGEVVGLIGRNGAGKSTILKILSRITSPTSGRAVLHGRVGSLLEIGTGFHPELTGRENIFMNGTILGMRRKEIAAKFDEIVDFSAIGQFLDTPVKRYSSGMYVRLAFAVAAHLDTEILLIDEVLAVGDVEFQKKCLGKMSEVARHGRTVLFVSHNMAAVKSLCGRCVWFQGGEIRTVGSSEEVINQYVEASLLDAESAQVAKRKDRKGRGEVLVDDVRVTYDNESGRWIARIAYHSGMKSIRNCFVVLNIHNTSGDTVVSLDSRCIPEIPYEWAGSGSVEIRLSPDVGLTQGDYACDIIFAAGNDIEDHVANAYLLKVGDDVPFGWKTNPPQKAVFSARQEWQFAPLQ